MFKNVGNPLVYRSLLNGFVFSNMFHHMHTQFPINPFGFPFFSSLTAHILKDQQHPAKRSASLQTAPAQLQPFHPLPASKRIHLPLSPGVLCSLKETDYNRPRATCQLSLLHVSVYLSSSVLLAFIFSHTYTHNLPLTHSS